MMKGNEILLCATNISLVQLHPLRQSKYNSSVCLQTRYGLKYVLLYNDVGDQWREFRSIWLPWELQVTYNLDVQWGKWIKLMYSLFVKCKLQDSLLGYDIVWFYRWVLFHKNLLPPCSEWRKPFYPERGGDSFFQHIDTRLLNRTDSCPRRSPEDLATCKCRNFKYHLSYQS